MKYDIAIYGGGTSGVAAAYIASKYGLNTLLVEKTECLGGSITQGLVIPSMKVETNNINTEFMEDLVAYADKFDARHTYLDDNKLWFNHELLKIVLDKMLSDVNCSVLFACQPIDIVYNNNMSLFEHFLSFKNLSLYIETKYIIDATGDGNIFKILGCDFQSKNELSQSPSLRFVVSNIDIKKFANWLENYDANRDVTTIQRTDRQIYLSTAYTWENKGWALSPIFDAAVKNGDLEYDDTAYFQLFSIPQMPSSLNFNAPRIILSKDEDLSDPFVYSRALKQGRERIYRLHRFMKKYLTGFENSYISHISDILGVREYNRVKCQYTVTVDNIINPKKFDNTALACNYPIDIHSNSKENDTLKKINHTYYIPIETLISEKYSNLYGVGKIISAEFQAQAALRTQTSCFSMGEAASKDILKKIKVKN